jgi:hypothetical protein
MEASRRRMPLDAEPVGDGTIVLVANGGLTPLARVVRAENREEVEGEAAALGLGVEWFRSHFASCPNAGAHRRPAAA